MAFLYNGTVLGVVLAVLRSGGKFGLPNACFFLNKKAAQAYTNANPKQNVKDVSKRYSIDLKELLPLAKPIVLEFDAAKIRINYKGIEIMTGQPEFEAAGPAHLCTLTEKSKKEIIKKLGIVKGDELYKVLYF